MAVTPNRWQDHWPAIKGAVKRRWGKLTDDDLAVLSGRREDLVSALQKRYGYARTQAEMEIDQWWSEQVSRNGR